MAFLLERVIQCTFHPMHEALQFDNCHRYTNFFLKNQSCGDLYKHVTMSINSISRWVIN